MKYLHNRTSLNIHAHIPLALALCSNGSDSYMYEEQQGEVPGEHPDLGNTLTCKTDVAVGQGSLAVSGTENSPK